MNMNVIKDTVGDLKAKHLWPLAVVLVIAIIAVPLLVSSSSKPSPAPAGASPSLPPLPGLPVVSAKVTATASHPSGPSRNPFTGSGSTTSVTSASTSVSSTSSPGSTSGSTSSTGGSGSTSNASSASSGGSSSASAPQSSSTAPTSILPAGTPPPKPAPGTLTPSQSYEVSLAITNSKGGLDTIDPLKRLSILPSDQNPLLVELGVLKGGHRVLFAVQPGAVVGGPGTCTPGPIDCEILSLAPGQTESLSQTSATGTAQVALFAIAGVSAVDRGSAAAAQKARHQEDAAGRAVLNSSQLSALSLFQYQPALGAVVDLRNLQVGG